MDSKIDYNNYKADSLLNDAYFLESEQHPTPESIMFWDKLAQENKQLAKEIAIARNFLHILRHVPKPYLPQQSRFHLEMYIRSESFGNTEQKKETHSIPHFSCSLHCCLPCKWLVSAKYLSDKRVHGKI